MDLGLLDLPLGVKIYVNSKAKPVFCRGKLGEKLHGLSIYFDLDDPYLHEMNLKYNCLHDPHLQKYHKRKDILQMLKKQGAVTSDNKVVCTVKEFNDYRHYLTRVKLQSKKILGQQEEGLLPPWAKLKYVPKRSGTAYTSRRAKQWMQLQKPGGPHPQKSKKIPLKLRRLRRVKIPLLEVKTYPRAELGQKNAITAAVSQRTLDRTTDSLFKAVLEHLTAAEAQKLQEMVETIVYTVFARLNIPRDQRISFLRKAAQGIRGSVVSSVRTKTPLDHCQEMEMVAKELVAMVLESLGNHLESKASEPGRAARQKEQLFDGRATRANKSKEVRTSFSDRARLRACLDKLTRQVVKNVRCLLKTMIASEFEAYSSWEYTEILKLPKGKVSNRKMRPGFPGASKQQSQEASIGPELQAEGTGSAKIRKPEGPAVVKESLVREGNPATSGNTSYTRATSKTSSVTADL